MFKQEKEELKEKINKELLDVAGVLLELAEVTVLSPEVYAKFRSRTLRKINNAIRALHKHIDEEVE
jgi:hypothetical protein